jgi:hypothetical protein
MKRLMIAGLALLVAACGDQSEDGAVDDQSIEELANAPRTPMPPICKDARENRFEPTTMIGQSTDKDVGGVGFTGHTKGELALAESFNTEITRVNKMVGSIRKSAAEAMTAAGLPKNAAGTASGADYYQLPPRHLTVDDIDVMCTMFPGYSSERLKRREAAQAKAMCQMMGMPSNPGDDDCIGPTFK